MWYVFAAFAAVAAVYLYETQDNPGGTGTVAGWAQTMASAMASFENSNPAYNNPLAVQGTGDTGTTAPNGLGIFSSAEAGLQAGIALLESYASRFPDLTINQAIARWATGNTEDTSDSTVNYQNQVSDALGVDGSTTTLGDLSGDDDDSGDP